MQSGRLEKNNRRIGYRKVKGYWKAKYSPKVAVTFSPELFEALDAQAEKYGVSFAQVVRACCEKALGRGVYKK